MIIALYIITLGIFSVYSYALLDPNITFFNHPAWTTFREAMVQIGYHNRPLSFSVYFILILLLFFLHHSFVRNYKKHPALRIAVITGILLLCSYPFLSHDFFNYMFDAKIITHYGENPYLMKPMDFPDDPWLRFMHWTHRTYPYGPVFLVISLIPALFGLGTFLLHYAFLKVMIIGFYIGMIYLIQKIDSQKALEFATHPFILVEGLINGHNDFIALALGVYGFYFIWRAKEPNIIHLFQTYTKKGMLKYLKSSDIFGRLMMILSAGIKYISLPYVFMTKEKESIWNKGSFLLTVGLIGYLAITREIQPWYIFHLFLFALLWKDIIQQWQIFLMGLLLSYFPFIYLGGWADGFHVQIKHGIIISFFILNIFFFLYKKKKLMTKGV